MNKHMLAILFFTALSSSIINASPDRVTLSCNIKYGSLNTFTMSFECPKSDSFSMPIEVNTPTGINSGMMSGSVETDFTRLKGYYMLNINITDESGPIVLDLTASPNFDDAFGYGINYNMESLIINCKKDY